MWLPADLRSGSEPALVPVAPHQTDVRVRFYELDPYNHVNHSVYIQYFETARIELLSEVGFGLDTLQTRGQQLVVVGLRTRFLRTAGLGDVLTVESGILNAGRVRTTWAQRISLSADVVATQLVDFATTDLAGRPLRTRTELTEAMTPYAVDEHWLGRHTP